ncbi:unnamed protein product [Sphagnum balticum]
MVTIEVRDISKLAGIIRIPSMSEGADAGETTAQRILYSGLPNQCRKCRHFGHLARTCPQNKPPTQGGNTSVKPPPPKGSWKTAPRKTPGVQRWRQTTANTAEGQPDLEMKESSELPTHPEDKAKHTQELLAEGCQKLNAFRNSTPNFEFQEMASAQAPSLAAKSNPFAILGEDSAGAVTLMEEQEDTKVGWSFQGRKRQDPKQTPPRQTTQQLSPPPPHRESTLGGKRGQLHSEVHPSYFTSLDIQVLPSKEPLRARIWPILTRIKEEKRKHLSSAETSLTQTSPSASKSQAQQKQLKQNGLMKQQGPTSSSAWNWS